MGEGAQEYLISPIWSPHFRPSVLNYIVPLGFRFECPAAIFERLNAPAPTLMCRPVGDTSEVSFMSPQSTMYHFGHYLSKRRNWLSE